LPYLFHDAKADTRRDNIPRSTLDRFCIHHYDDKITREQIFHYVYAVLHHPDYRARYAENLKRELPRIPMTGTAEDFHAFARAGRKLADLHTGCESVKPHKLARIENREVPVNWRVEAMKLGKDGRAVIYNDWLTLDGIPPEALEYRLGNRSALARGPQRRISAFSTGASLLPDSHATTAKRPSGAAATLGAAPLASRTRGDSPGRRTSRPVLPCHAITGPRAVAATAGSRPSPSVSSGAPGRAR